MLGVFVSQFATSSSSNPNSNDPHNPREGSRCPTPEVVSVLEDYFNEDDDTQLKDEGSGRYSLSLIPFSVLLPRKGIELPEDVERIIFEIAAREDIKAAVDTLVYVCHRVRHWVEYVIYNSAILKDSRRARLFLDSLEEKHPDFTERAVRILALPPRVSDDTERGILEACKNLEHLSWLAISPLSPELIEVISNLRLKSLRLRLSTMLGDEPDFSSPIFEKINTLFISDSSAFWKEWRWDGLRTRPNIKWIAINLDGRLHRYSGWRLVRALETRLLKPYAGPHGVQLCICYHYNEKITGGRWVHRSEETFSEERLAILSLDHRIDEKQWVKRINGESRDFEISEQLIRERFEEDRRLRFGSPHPLSSVFPQ